MLGEEITAVAIALSDGLILTMPPPARHHDIIHHRQNPLDLTQPDQQGFLTSKGRFVTRREAAGIAKQARQVDKVAHPEHGLFSEDLW